MADNTDIYTYDGSESELDENALILKVIDPTDTIKTMMEKCNYNFTQLVMHGGGPRGIQGLPGIDGATGKKGNGIYIVTSDSSDSDSDMVDVDLSLYNAGDIILCNGKLYQVTESDDSENVLEEVGSIVGPEGPEGPEGQAARDILDFFAKKAEEGDVYLAPGVGHFFLFSDADSDVSFSDSDGLPETTSYTLNFVRKDDGIGFYTTEGIKTACIAVSDDIDENCNDSCLKIATENEIGLDLYSKKHIKIDAPKIIIGKEGGNGSIVFRSPIDGTTEFENIKCEKITLTGNATIEGDVNFSGDVSFTSGLSLDTICVNNIKPIYTGNHLGNLSLGGNEILIGKVYPTPTGDDINTENIILESSGSITLRSGRTDQELGGKINIWSGATTIGGNDVYIGEQFGNNSNNYKKTKRIHVFAEESISITGDVSISGYVKVKNGNGYDVYGGGPIGQICMYPSFATTPVHWKECPATRNNNTFAALYAIGTCSEVIPTSLGINISNMSVTQVHDDTLKALENQGKIGFSLYVNYPLDVLMDQRERLRKEAANGYLYFEVKPYDTHLTALAEAYFQGKTFEINSSTPDCGKWLDIKKEDDDNTYKITRITYAHLPILERSSDMKYIVRYE